MLRAAGLAALLILAVNARQLQQDDTRIKERVIGDLARPQDTVFALGGGNSGSVQITGMLQNFPLDQSQPDPVDALLDRPKTSYLEVSWPHWIDQRLELMDLFQEMISTPVRPRCPHSLPQSGSAMDNGMVSYLASSRFGPAILTTYSRQVGEQESDDFDWRNVNIPTGDSNIKTYEDASMQEELRTDADKAFKLAELESMLSAKEPKKGYFGANMRGTKEQMMYNSLDGDSESVQPVILTSPDLTSFEDIRARSGLVSDDMYEEDEEMEAGEGMDKTQLAVFVLLLIGCCYVWTCLIVSCKKLGNESSQEHVESQKVAGELLTPLEPEGLEKGSSVQIASKFVAPGAYFAPHGTSISKLSVPLVTAEHP